MKSSTTVSGPSSLGSARAIDAFRGLAQMSVIAFHFDIVCHVQSFPMLHNIMSLMDFFFILSGYVMTSSYYQSIGCSGHVIPFFIRRIGRMWPLHILALLAFVGLEILKLIYQQGDLTHFLHPAFTDSKSIPALIANVFLVHSFGFFNSATWNYPSWSLSVELLAYFSFSAFALAKPDKPALTALLIAGLCAAFLLVVSRNGLNTDAQFGGMRGVCGFFIGIALNLGTRDLQKRSHFRLPYASLWEIGILALTVAYMLHSYDGVWTFLALPLYSAFVFIFTVEQGLISNMMRLRPLQLIGTWSFSIYIWHALLLVLLKGVIHGLSHGVLPWLPAYHAMNDANLPTEMLDAGSLWGGDVLFVLFAGFTLLIARYSYHWLEEPSRIWSKQLAARYEARQRLHDRIAELSR